MLKFVLAFCLAFATSAFANDLTIIAGASAGGGHAVGARLIAKYLPGGAIVKAMPGAGGVKSVLWLHDVAPRDGSAIGTFSPTAVIDHNPLDFTWLGTTSSYEHDAYGLWVRPDSRFKSIEDLRKHTGDPLIVGGAGGGAGGSDHPRILKEALGLNLKVVTGYSSGFEVFVAVDRGEVDSKMVGYASVKTVRPDWIDKMHVLLAYARDTRFPKWPNVPTALELAQSDADRALIEFAQAPFKLARPYAAPPEVGAEVAHRLQSAFMAVMNNPSYRAEAKRMGMDVSPLNGEKVRAVLEKMVATPVAVRERMKEALR